MRILVVGARWYGHTTEFVCHAVRSLGHRPIPLVYRPWQTPRMGDEPIRSVRLNQRLRRDALRHAPDLVLLLKGEFVGEDTLLWLKQKGIPTASWWFDDPRPWKDCLASLRAVDWFFIFDKAYVSVLRTIRSRAIHYLPLGFSPEAYVPAPRAFPPRWDVTFVGTPYPPRIRMLENLRGQGLRIVGPGWKKVAPQLIPFVAARPKISPLETCRLYWKSAMVLNLHHAQSLTAPNQRTFEIAGSGAFQLVDDKPRLNDFFEKGKEVVAFRGRSDLAEKVRYYLDHPDEAAAVASRATRRAHREHTYARRIEEMLSVLSSR